MAQTLAAFDNGMTARVTKLGGLDKALYTFGEETILVGAGYFGQPERRALMIELGAPGDRSGYRLTGLTVGDWLLTGTLMCEGDGLTPGRHPHGSRYPLEDVTDPAAAEEAAAFLAELAQHCYGLLNP